MPNGLALLIHKKNPPHFQGCWGKMKKLSEEKIVTELMGKKLLPGSGETDYNHRFYHFVLSTSFL